MTVRGQYTINSYTNFSFRETNPKLYLFFILKNSRIACFLQSYDSIEYFQFIHNKTTWQLALSFLQWWPYISSFSFLVTSVRLYKTIFFILLSNFLQCLQLLIRTFLKWISLYNTNFTFVCKILFGFRLILCYNWFFNIIFYNTLYIYRILKPNILYSQKLSDFALNYL